MLQGRSFKCRKEVEHLQSVVGHLTKYLIGHLKVSHVKKTSYRPNKIKSIVTKLQIFPWILTQPQLSKIFWTTFIHLPHKINQIKKCWQIWLQEHLCQPINTNVASNLGWISYIHIHSMPSSYALCQNLVPQKGCIKAWRKILV